MIRVEKPAQEALSQFCKEEGGKKVQYEASRAIEEHIANKKNGK